MEQKTHTLKILPEFFAAVLCGAKKAEFRLNDRNFNAGDLLILQEWDSEKSIYTGREIAVKVTHVVELSHVMAPGFIDAQCFVMMSIALPVGYAYRNGSLSPNFQVVCK